MARSRTRAVCQPHHDGIAFHCARTASLPRSARLDDVSKLAGIVVPCRKLLAVARDAGMTVIHTREGHRPDLSDAPRAKVERGAPTMRIGDRGPMGRILV